MYETKSVMKWFIPKTIDSALYFGFRFDMDGFALMTGFKIAGIKAIFPILIVNPPTKDHSEKMGIEV